MPIRIVFDRPGHQTRHQLVRLSAWLLGAPLVTIGLLATVVAIPSGFITLGDVVGRWQHEQVVPPEVPLAAVELAFAASLTIAIIGIRYGRRLVRGTRSPVLFLRRFGYRGSMRVVTFAVANTIGSSWRLVTLDDAAIAPVGVDTSSRFVFGVGGHLAKLAVATGKGVMAGMQYAISGIWIVAAIQLAVAWPNWRHLLTDGTLRTYAKIYAMLMEGKVPVHYFGPTLPGAFAILGTAAAFCFVGLMVVFVVVLALFPLFGFVVLASSSAEALRKAESAQRDTITDAWHVHAVVAEVARRGRETFAPRLVVLRVASSAWQQAVSALASATAVSIVDISELTENIAWELDELQRLRPGRCILIGEQACIARWASELAPGRESLDGHLARLLDGRDVIAYTTDRKGMRRFARALYGALIDTAGAPEDGGVYRI
jgi:hypothetical protein